MKERFNAQDLIDMGADLFDNKGFDRQKIRLFLECLRDNGKTEPGIDIDTIYDLIVG